jgi:hypothetical protein
VTIVVNFFLSSLSACLYGALQIARVIIGTWQAYPLRIGLDTTFTCWPCASGMHILEGRISSGPLGTATNSEPGNAFFALSTARAFVAASSRLDRFGHFH